MERVMDTGELTIPIPLPGGRRWVVLTLPRPLTGAEWRYLQTVLDTMRPGLVLSPVSADVRDPDQPDELTKERS